MQVGQDLMPICQGQILGWALDPPTMRPIGALVPHLIIGFITVGAPVVGGSMTELVDFLTEGAVLAGGLPEPNPQLHPPANICVWFDPCP